MATSTKKQDTKTTAKTRSTAKQTERNARALLTDGAYAAVGLGDSTVELLRTLPVQVDKLRTEAPKTFESFLSPAELKTRLEVARKDAEKEFEAFATRGRTVVESISNSAATRRALEQTRTARAQVRAAVTSVRRAVGQSVDAAEAATDKVGQDR